MSDGGTDCGNGNQANQPAREPQSNDRAYNRAHNQSHYRIREKHPRIIRWCHWLNFPLLMIMIWSGILIYWANDAYIEIPPTLAVALGINHHLAIGLAWHFFLMWFFALNGIIYVAYLALSGEWREIVPTRSSFKEACSVVLHELGVRSDNVYKSGKFNGAQRIAYTTILICGAGSLVTGVAIYKPVQAGWLTELLGGYEAARFQHFILMVIFILFFVVHLLQVARAGWNNLRAMVAGYEITSDRVSNIESDLEHDSSRTP